MVHIAYFSITMTSKLEYIRFFAVPFCPVARYALILTCSWEDGIDVLRLLLFGIPTFCFWWSEET
jgi:hypothetical protein